MDLLLGYTTKSLTWVGVKGSHLAYLFLYLIQEFTSLVVEVQREGERECSFSDGPFAMTLLYVWQGSKYILSLGFKSKFFCREVLL